MSDGASKSLKQENIPCPMCKKNLRALSKNNFILKCDWCNIIFAVGEIVEQDKTNFCVFANKCVIHDPFTKKDRTRIFCVDYKEFNAIDFCKRTCEYRTTNIKNTKE